MTTQATAIQVDPLFDSLRETLRWAYNHTQGMHRDTLARFQKPNPGGRGIGGGLDAAHTAGLILGQVALLSKLDQQIIEARHVDREIQCGCRAPCCIGRRPNRYWVDPVNELAEQAVQILPGCVVKRRLLQGIVGRHFGSGEKLKDIAERADVHPDTASAHNAKIVDWLQKGESAASRRVAEKLEAIGIIFSQSA